VLADFQIVIYKQIRLSQSTIDTKLSRDCLNLTVGNIASFLPACSTFFFYHPRCFPPNKHNPFKSFYLSLDQFSVPCALPTYIVNATVLPLCARYFALTLPQTVPFPGAYTASLIACTLSQHCTDNIGITKTRKVLS
jgi:hypothetical protein